jgi:hypothetical protein
MNSSHTSGRPYRSVYKPHRPQPWQLECRRLKFNPWDESVPRVARWTRPAAGEWDVSDRYFECAALAEEGGRF